MLSNNNILKKLASGSLLAAITMSFLSAATDKTVASTTNVSAELVLSIDISGSVDSREYNLQMDGYAAAFKSKEVIKAIKELPNGLAVTTQFWSSRPAPPLPWKVIKTEAQAKAYANMLDTLPRPSYKTHSIYTENGQNIDIGYGTNITGAISAATDAILNNQYDGKSLIIDVSGDGITNRTQYNGSDSFISGNKHDAVKKASDSAVANGITVNGLPIEAKKKSKYITNYYKLYVKGGSHAFIQTASSFNDFKSAAKKKIEKEITRAANQLKNSPTAKPDTIVTNEDTKVNYNVIKGSSQDNFAGKDFDPNGKALKVTNIRVGAQNYKPGAEITMPSGALLTVKNNGDTSYNPNGKFEGLGKDGKVTNPDTFVYTISNPKGYTGTALATLNVRGVDDDPNAVDDSSTTDEDTSKSINVLDNDTDPDTKKGDLTITHINDVPVSVGVPIVLPSKDIMTLNQDKTITYDPSKNPVLNQLNNGGKQTIKFSYTISDLSGNTDKADVSVIVDGKDDTFAD